MRLQRAYIYKYLAVMWSFQKDIYKYKNTGSNFLHHRTKWQRDLFSFYNLAIILWMPLYKHLYKNKL